jgi:hypothetical protein
MQFERMVFAALFAGTSGVEVAEGSVIEKRIDAGHPVQVALNDGHGEACR